MEIILSTPILVCLVFLVNNISRNKNSFHEIRHIILIVGFVSRSLGQQ